MLDEEAAIMVLEGLRAQYSELCSIAGVCDMAAAVESE